MLADRTGLPRVVAVWAATSYDSVGWPPLVRAIPAVRSRRSAPRRRAGQALHADTGYDYPHPRAWLRARRLTPTSPAGASTPPPGSAAHRGQVVSTLAHPVGDRRLATSSGRHPDRCCAFPTLAAAFTCYHRLTT